MLYSYQRVTTNNSDGVAELNNDWFLDEFTIEYVKLLQGVLGELEGLMCDSSYCEKLQCEFPYWKERVEVSLSEPLTGDPLEKPRKELYSSEIRKAMLEASKAIEEIPPSFSSIVQLYEDFDIGRTETVSIFDHRKAFVLAYFIHSWKISTNDKTKASEVISKAYESVYPPCNDDLCNLMNTVVPELLKPIPLFVREALKPMVDNGSIVCAGSYYVVIRSVRDTFFYFSKTLNEEFYRQWVRKADGTKYSYSAFHRNRYSDPDING